MGEPWPPGGLRTLLAPTVPDERSAPRWDPLALYARLLGAGDLPAAAQALVSALAAQAEVGRASIGLHARGRTTLLASTGLPPGQADGALAERLVGAMNEALDQGLVLALPAPPAPDGAPAPADSAADAVRVELALLRASPAASVAVVPMAIDGQRVGALCLERDDGPPFTAAELSALTHLMTLAAPALRWMQRAEWPWHQRAWAQLRAGIDALRRPSRRLQRRLLAAGGLLLAFVALAPLPHEVGGRARIEGAEQRVLAAPTDGFVKTAHVRPGDRVRAGDPLLDLLEDDLALERERWASQLAQHENGYAAAMARADRVGAATSMARVTEAQSQLALVAERLSRGRLVAPFDALVIDGDLSQSIGAPVRQGDTLLTLATTGRHRVIVEVDETDIARVAPGQGGSLAVSALPWQSEAIVVERIAPMARAVEGRNVFEVEARLVSPADALRPGLLGRAQIEIGHRPPLWAWLGHALDRLRMAWWAWMG